MERMSKSVRLESCSHCSSHTWRSSPRWVEKKQAGMSQLGFDDWQTNDHNYTKNQNGFLWAQTKKNGSSWIKFETVTSCEVGSCLYMNCPNESYRHIQYVTMFYRVLSQITSRRYLYTIIPCCPIVSQIVSHVYHRSYDPYFGNEILRLLQLSPLASMPDSKFHFVTEYSSQPLVWKLIYTILRL